jgi:hypothetical protein
MGSGFDEERKGQVQRVRLECEVTEVCAVSMPLICLSVSLRSDLTQGSRKVLMSIRQLLQYMSDTHTTQGDQPASLSRRLPSACRSEWFPAKTGRSGELQTAPGRSLTLSTETNCHDRRTESPPSPETRKRSRNRTDHVAYPTKGPPQHQTSALLRDPACTVSDEVDSSGTVPMIHQLHQLVQRVQQLLRLSRGSLHEHIA